MALDRRFLLRGAFQGSAVAMALPLLDCFLDGNGQALADTGKRIPTRFGTYFWGCGLTKELFVPKTIGANYETTQQLAPLEPYKKKISVFSGLRAIVDDNPNFQHWTGLAAITTGISPTRTGEFDSQTIDQTIADTIGHGTRFKSIETTCAGNKNESYSSLGGANTNPPEISPLGLYTRLFGPGFQDPSKGDWKPDPQVLVHQSMLSVVADDRKRLMANLSGGDKARMDQYFTSVRELEQSMDGRAEAARCRGASDHSRGARRNAGKQVGAGTAESRADDVPAHGAGPRDQPDACLQYRAGRAGLDDLHARRFQALPPADARRADRPGAGLSARLREFQHPQHGIFRHADKGAGGYQEGDGTLLDHSLVLAYTDTSFAKLHALDGIPVLLAGSASGRVKTGYHIAGEGSPVSRVGLTVQQAMGLSIDGWGKGSMATKKTFSEILA